LTIKNAKGIQFKNVKITNKEGLPVVLDNAQVTGLEEKDAKK
jgi:hypothetical protein